MKKAHQDGGMDILFSCLHVGSGPTACIVFFSLLSGKALFMGCEPPACLPSTLKLDVLAKHTTFYRRFLNPVTTGPRNSSRQHKLHQCTFVDVLAQSGVWVLLSLGTLQSTCGPFPLAAEQTEPAPLPGCVDEGASGVWSAADCLRGASEQ
eukprot:1158243-Pelagomonas_calceolata.AAC.3